MSEAAAERGQDASARPQVGVPACLLGQPVRFNRGHSRSRFRSPSCGLHGIPRFSPRSSRGSGGAGRVVAAAGRPPRAATETGYRDLFTAAMFSRTTRGRHANTLQHAFSRTGRDLGRGRRADLSARIESYRRGADPLSVPVALLGHYVSEGDLPWLAGQTYLEPYPDALRLRHAVPR
jgi:uncharacterized protein YbgA (DUF1722 family)